MHKKPSHIFTNNDGDRLAAYLYQAAQRPMMVHVLAEAQRLRPLFNAAAQALAPYDIAPADITPADSTLADSTLADRAVLSADGLSDLYKKSAIATGHICYGTPLILGERVLRMTKNYIAENALRREINFKTVIPPARSHKMRMFRTAGFGFLSLQSQTDKDAYPKRIVIPFYSIPDEFINDTQTHDLLEEAARFSFWFNHDYFHQMIYFALDKESFGTEHENAPLSALPRDSVRSLENTWRNSSLDAQFKVESHIEPWAMRFHREALTTLYHENPQHNPLRKALNRFLDVYENSGLPAAQDKMADPPIYKQEYAMRLAAFNLIRAESVRHEFVEHAINRFDTIRLNTPHGPAALPETRRAFLKLYNTLYTETFYGAGDNEDAGTQECETPEIYRDRIMALSAHSLKIAAQDFDAALRHACHRTPEDHSLRWAKQKWAKQKYALS